MYITIYCIIGLVNLKQNVVFKMLIPDCYSCKVIYPITTSG